MRMSLLASWVCAAVALPVMASDVTYSKDVAPLIKKYCAECHSPPDAPPLSEFLLDVEKYKEAKVGPRHDTYEHLMQLVNGKDTGALMRRLDNGSSPYAKGKAGNMFKYLCEKGNDAECAANLKLMTEWVVGEGNTWDLNGRGPIGDIPPVTPEQLGRIKAKP